VFAGFAILAKSRALGPPSLMKQRCRSSTKPSRCRRCAAGSDTSDAAGDVPALALGDLRVDGTRGLIAPLIEIKLIAVTINQRLGR